MWAVRAAENCFECWIVDFGSMKFWISDFPILDLGFTDFWIHKQPIQSSFPPQRRRACPGAATSTVAVWCPGDTRGSATNSRACDDKDDDIHS